MGTIVCDHLVPIDQECQECYSESPEQPDTESTEGKAMENELAAMLNSYSAENRSDTPDYILAEYMLDCLAAWNVACRKRENWYGRGLEMKPATTST